MGTHARIDLRIVPSERVRPHEIADPIREERIERRLRADGILRDPLMVGAIQDVPGYVLLDGTNRRRALMALTCAYVMVQVIDYADDRDVQLRSWCHAADMPLNEILEGVRAISDLAATQVPSLGASDSLRAAGTLGLVLNTDTQIALVRAPGAETSAAQLRHLVDLYEHKMVRVDCSADEVEERAQALEAGKTLVAFPGFSRSQVVTMAMRGTLIPAGITRHIILIGRALRVNVPLEMLSGDHDLAHANAELQIHLRALQPRLYREPTILYDS